jgi:hypothetical protein
MLDGSLEPLEQALDQSPRSLPLLMRQTEFQSALLAAMREKLPLETPTTAEIRELLLEEWVVRGDATRGRELVMQDLTTDPAAAVRVYVEQLRQYLVPDERPAESDRVVAEVLLAPDVAGRLLALLPSPQDRLTVHLARIRRALLANDLKQAQGALGEAWQASSELPPDAMNLRRLQRGTTNGEGDDAAVEAAFRQLRDLIHNGIISGQDQRTAGTLERRAAGLSRLSGPAEPGAGGLECGAQ